MNLKNIKLIIILIFVTLFLIAILLGSLLIINNKNGDNKNTLNQSSINTKSVNENNFKINTSKLTTNVSSKNSNLNNKTTSTNLDLSIKSNSNSEQTKDNYIQDLLKLNDKNIIKEFNNGKFLIIDGEAVEDDNIFNKFDFKNTFIEKQVKKNYNKGYDNQKYFYFIKDNNIYYLGNNMISGFYEVKLSDENYWLIKYSDKFNSQYIYLVNKDFKSMRQIELPSSYFVDFQQSKDLKVFNVQIIGNDENGQKLENWELNLDYYLNNDLFFIQKN